MNLRELCMHEPEAFLAFIALLLDDPTFQVEDRPSGGGTELSVVDASGTTLNQYVWDGHSWKELE